jgi:hypothetical protein
MLKYDHLLGRPFKHGSKDCYGLIRDFYLDNFGIPLRNYARPDDHWDNGLNLYMELFHAEGFRPLDCLPMFWRPGDALLMAIRSSVANHAAVIVEDGLILHHLYGGLSRAEPYRGFFRDTTVAVLRHKDVTYEPEEKTLDLLESLPDALRRKLADFLPDRGE